MSNAVKTILGILCSIVLCFIIYLEGKYLLNVFTERNEAIYNATVVIANDKAQAQVSIDRVYTYDEIPVEEVTGDVIDIEGLVANIHLSGLLVDTTDEYAGFISYTDDDRMTHRLYIESKTVNLEVYQEGILDYWNIGSFEKLLNAYGNPYQPENIKTYQQSFNGERVPIIYNEATELYYMFVDMDTVMCVISSDMLFALSDDMVTVHFSNPSIEVLKNHNYSMYELTAAENTKNELAKEDDKDLPEYESSGVVGTADTYTSSADNSLRKEMASYADYEWDENGEADGTTLTIDFTSQEAKKSQWTLTDSVYSYTRAGLIVNAVSATRGEDSFEVSCNINNTLDTERPFVLVLKYISADGKLLGLSVLDYRAEPIASKGVTLCRKTISKTGLGTSCNNIVAVQFEVY